MHTTLTGALRALLHLPLRLTSVLPFPSSLAHCTQLGGPELVKLLPILQPLPLHFHPRPCPQVPAGLSVRIPSVYPCHRLE